MAHETLELAGDGVGGAVRIGDTVRRPAGPWTPTVHALLDHLTTAGLDSIPRACGVDEEGREVLTFIAGETVYSDRAEDATGWPDWVWSDELLVEAARWLARYHRAVASYRPTNAHWRSGPRPLASDEIVCHFDFRPANVVVTEPDGGGRRRLVGVVDWDTAGPGRAIFDVALMAWSWVPLWDVRRGNVEEVARRLALLTTAYGRFDPLEVLAAVPDRLTAAATTRAMAANGDAAMERLVAADLANHDRMEKVAGRLRAYLPLVAGELASAFPLRSARE
ncbi:MAG TPA: aminoglycoside phosphotransferase family protein [Actinopolymorphaceae bacterium]